MRSPQALVVPYFKGLETLISTYILSQYVNCTMEDEFVLITLHSVFCIYYSGIQFWTFNAVE